MEYMNNKDSLFSASSIRSTKILGVSETNVFPHNKYVSKLGIWWNRQSL